MHGVGVEEVIDFFVIDLQERTENGDMFPFLLLSPPDFLEEILNSSLSDTHVIALHVNHRLLGNAGGRFVLVVALCVVIPFHGVGFP